MGSSYRPDVPRVYGEFAAEISDLRVVGLGKVRFRCDAVLPDPDALLRMAEAQSAEVVHIVILADETGPIPIPGTEEDPGDMALRTARALRLYAALEVATMAARRHGEIPFEPSDDGATPPFPPGTEVGSNDAETRMRVGELVDADPDAAAQAAARALSPNRRRRRKPDDPPAASGE